MTDPSHRGVRPMSAWASVVSLPRINGWLWLMQPSVAECVVVVALVLGEGMSCAISGYWP